jgi:hypothetical protein
MTVEPYTQVFHLKDLIVSYLGTGGIPVKVRSRQAVVASSCEYIRTELSLYWTTDSMTLSNVACTQKSHNSSALPLRITYDVDVTATYGPSLDTQTYYLEDNEAIEFSFDVELMFEDKFYDNKTLEMSTFVNNAIGPTNTYYNYSGVSIVRYLNY